MSSSMPSKLKNQEQQKIQSCAGCRYYLEYDDLETDPEEPDAPTGVCRRYPPKLFPGSPMAVSLFPDVSKDVDWCGEFLPVASEDP